ncbi:hypothetical protein AHMF7605_26495 [Adhaeribacter arboris]|uniref:Uncharacterized protein n=1 Tax=Adhaeribacter arboris TaxID=2072846 RepID=A0A2T2YMP9_9BACT|nr:hypothetical protein [Adhaeribacter arboris]PSR56794.1 hypothetical protein AHMF7605_26495 [Adhaeribacter arboris]
MHEYQNRNRNDRDDHLAENQRIGKRIAEENRNQNWNEQYRSGRDYHNSPESNNGGQQHYGADPNSAYRNANINFGDNRDNRDNYNRQQNFQQNNQQHWPVDRGQDNYRHEERVRDNQFNQDNRNRNNFNPGNRYLNDRYQANRPDQGERYDVNRYTESDNRFYAGEEPRLFDDRKQFQAEDYRYGSGNRHWEAPGHDEDYDADNDRNKNRRRHNDQQDNRGFFGRIADQVREDWRTFTHPDDGQNQNNQNNQNWRSEPRNFNRGYESGPRWADEDDSQRRNNERRSNRNYDEDNRRW